MTTDHAAERARPHAPIHRLTLEADWAAIRAGRLIVPLTRNQATVGKAVGLRHVTFSGGQPKSVRSAVSFVDPEHAPAFEGKVGWFEVERVRAKPRAYRRAIRQVEPPAGA